MTKRTTLEKLDLLSAYSFTIIHAITYFIITGLSVYYGAIKFNIPTGEVITYTAIIKATLGSIFIAAVYTLAYSLVIQDDMKNAHYCTHENIKKHKIKYALSTAFVIAVLSFFAFVVNEFSGMIKPEIPYYSLYMISFSTTILLMFLRSFIKSISDNPEYETTEKDNDA